MKSSHPHPALRTMLCIAHKAPDQTDVLVKKFSTDSCQLGCNLKFSVRFQNKQHFGQNESSSSLPSISSFNNNFSGVLDNDICFFCFSVY